MKILKHNLVMVLLVAVTTLGCKKSETKSDSTSSTSFAQGVAVKNGMLVFRDSTVFDSITHLFYRNNQHIDQWEKELSGFKSYRKFLSEAEVEFSKVSTNESYKAFKDKYYGKLLINQDSSLSNLYAFPSLSAFANTEGRFMVGDNLYILLPRGLVVINKPTFSKEKLALSKLESNQTQGIKVVLINPIEEKATVSAYPNVLPLGRLHEAVYYNNDRNRRLFVQLYHEYYVSEQYPGCQDRARLVLALYQQKKGLFGNWSNNSTNISMNGLIYSSSATRSDCISTGYSTYYGSYDGTLSNYPQSFSWSNVSNPVYYDLYMYSSMSGGTLINVRDIYNLYLKGHFASGGVPNTPDLELYLGY